MTKTLDSKELELQNNNPVTQKLINFLSRTRSFTSPVDHKDYVIKKRLMGKASRHCGEKMLMIKEIKYPVENEDSEEMLDCTYYFCTKCGQYLYDSSD